MTWSFYDNDGVNGVKQATQNAHQSATFGGWVDMAGCSLALSTGIWHVWSDVESMRIWNNFGAGGVGAYGIGVGIWRSDNGAEYARSAWTGTAPNSLDRFEQGGHSVSTVLAITSPITVKLRYFMQVHSGSDFASGPRWDSAFGGGPTHFHAVKVGA